MSATLTAVGLCFLSLNAYSEDPPKTENARVLSTRPVGVHVTAREKVKATQTEDKKEAHRNVSPAVPEEEPKAPVETGKKKSAPPRETKASDEAEAAKPLIKRPAKVVKANPEEGRRLAEAEARAAKLAADNARLQQELAKGQNLVSTEVKSPEEALAELKAGNARFAQGKRVRTLLAMQDPELRQTLAKGQAPFAVVLTCSDSRLMDNFIFDQELGRIFTIREAGNCADTQGLASVEYAVEHLGSKLVVVMGHGSCGAIKAVNQAHGKPLPGNLWSLQAAMAGLLESTPVDPNETPEEHMVALAENNARRQAQVLLDRSEIIRHLVSAGKVRIVPAFYDLASGSVRFLEAPAPEAEHGKH